MLTKTLQHTALLLIALVGTISLLQPGHNLPITSFFSEWLALALGIVACSVLLIPTVWNKLSIPIILNFVLAIAIYIAIQTLFVDQAYPAQTILPVLYLAWSAMLALLVCYLRDQFGLEPVASILAWLFLAGAVLQAIAAIVQFAGVSQSLNPFVGTPSHGGGGISGNIGQANHYATQITLGVIAAMFLRLRRRIAWGVVFALIVLLSLAAALSGSRSIWLYGLAAAFVSFIAFKKTRDRTYIESTLTASAFVFLFVLAQLSLPLLSQAINYLSIVFGFEIQTLTPVTAIERGSSGWEIRLAEWNKAFLIFLQHPILGVGIGNYGWHSFLLQSSETAGNVDLGNQLAHRPHNIFLDTLAELGIIGFLLLVALIGFWFRQFWRNWTNISHWYIAATLSVLFIHCNLEYPNWYSYYLGPIVIFLALGDSRVTYVRFSPRLGQVGASLSLLLVGVILIGTLQGYRHLASVYAPTWTLDPVRTARLVETVSANPLLTPWAEALMVTIGKPNRERVEDQLAVATRAMRFQPDAVRVQKKITYLALANRYEEATDLVRRFSIAYRSLFPKYVCELRSSMYSELNELARYGERLLPEGASCST